jgi:hypothetical protein
MGNSVTSRTHACVSNIATRRSDRFAATLTSYDPLHDQGQFVTRPVYVIRETESFLVLKMSFPKCRLLKPRETEETAVTSEEGEDGYQYSQKQNQGHFIPQ